MTHLIEQYAEDKLIDLFEKDLIQLLKKSMAFEELKSCCEGHNPKKLIAVSLPMELKMVVEKNPISQEKILPLLKKLEKKRNRKKNSLNQKIILLSLIGEIFSNHIDLFNPVCDYFKKAKHKNILNSLVKGENIKIPITKLYKKWTGAPTCIINITVVSNSLDKPSVAYEAGAIDNRLVNKGVFLFTVLKN